MLVDGAAVEHNNATIMRTQTMDRINTRILFLTSVLFSAIIFSNTLHHQSDVLEITNRISKMEEEMQAATATRRLMLREGSRSEARQPDAAVASISSPLPISESKNPSSQYAYAFVIGGCNPDNPSYKGFVYNILVATRVLRELGSTADVVAFFQLSYKYKGGSTLLDEDAKALQGLGIHIQYIPPSPYESFYETVMNKFRILTLTQYKRVILMDGDVMPVANLDYLFELSNDNKFGPGNSTLKENVIVAGPFEPANAGFFMLAPKEGEYEKITDIIHTRQEKAKQIKKGVKFDEVEGWGHKIEAPDQWVSRRSKGTHWDFHFAFSDQGLCKSRYVRHCNAEYLTTTTIVTVYHWTKYVKKNVSIVFKSRVENWSADPEGHVVMKQNLDQPFRSYSKPVVKQFSACAKFMCDFIHFSGKSKPWIGQPPKDMSELTQLKDGNHVWWSFLAKVNKELSMGLDFDNFKVGRPELGLYASWRDMDKNIEKTRDAKAAS